MGGKNNFAIAAQGQVISLSEVRRAGRLPFALPTKEKGLLLAPIPVARAPARLSAFASLLAACFFSSITLSHYRPRTWRKTLYGNVLRRLIILSFNVKMESVAKAMRSFQLSIYRYISSLLVSLHRRVKVPSLYALHQFN